MQSHGKIGKISGEAGECSGSQPPFSQAPRHGSKVCEVQLGKAQPPGQAIAGMPLATYLMASFLADVAWVPTV